MDSEDDEKLKKMIGKVKEAINKDKKQCCNLEVEEIDKEEK